MLTHDQRYIRNFSIIAHIDHGKSTLSDRLIQLCDGLNAREMADQVLDSMEIERERGITIKAQCASLCYYADDGHEYRLNFIDTPGHVDFAYEVSRSLMACEGALLLVDAAQGVEAQSVANTYTAIDQGQEVLPVLNKIDLPQADPERVCAEIEQIVGIAATDAPRISAKEGHGIRELVEHLIAHIPPPSGDPAAPLQALIIDSWFDTYLGVVSLIRVQQGVLRVRDKILIKSRRQNHIAERIGIFTPKKQYCEQLSCGEVGFVIAAIRDVEGAPVGDTIVHATAMQTPALPGFRRVKPQVYAGLFPLSAEDYEALREALGRLRLNDNALEYEPETSDALGSGFRLGFLGMLHMEIVQERLEREYGLTLIISAPSVVYQAVLKNGEIIPVSNPSRLPASSTVMELREPIVRAAILTPQNCVGAILGLCEGRRGKQLAMHFHRAQVMIEYALPMHEVILDFFDRLKSLSHGYASLDYQFSHYQSADLVRLDLLINGERIDALANIVHRQVLEVQARALTEKIKDLIPQQMFAVAIQAAIGGRIVARQTVRALRKNVTAKCYGGDVTRKRKLLEKQKAGKRRMKKFGKVEIPQEAFLAAMRQ